MIPNFQLIGRECSVYMLLALAGFFIVLLLTYRLAAKHGLDEIVMLYAVLFAALGALLGGHLLYAFTNLETLKVYLSGQIPIRSLEEALNAIAAIFGGSVFYGGFLGGGLLVWLYLRRKPLRSRYFDLFAMAVPLFHAFGRLGCFLSGCCYGVECRLGFVYHYSLAPGANDVSRFPVQLVEMLGNICLFLLLYRLFLQGKRHLINIYLAIYPLMRFLLEFLRGDVYRGFWLGLSTSQWISLGLLAANAAVVIFQRKRRTASQ